MIKRQKIAMMLAFIGIFVVWGSLMTSMLVNNPTYFVFGYPVGATLAIIGWILS